MTDPDYYADEATRLLQTVNDETDRMIRQGKPDGLTELELVTAQLQVFTGIGYALLALKEEIKGTPYSISTIKDAINERS